ncbi:OPSUV protein, partial [Regulus satrapa]|nr:OPSUV protein [Regulus satrapa]
TATMDDEEFYLFKNQSSIGPWDGPQYHIAPMWAFYLQTIFMGLVFVAGTPLNAIVLIVTIKYKKLRQPLNYILVNISVSGLMCCIFCIFTVFVSSSQGYFVFGKHMCAFEGFSGATVGTRGPRGTRAAGDSGVTTGDTGGHVGNGGDHHVLLWLGSWGGCCGLAGLKVAKWVRAMGRAEPCDLLWLEELGRGLGGRGQQPGRPKESLSLAQVAAQQQESATTQKAEREVSRMVVVMVGSFCLCYVPYAALAMYMVNNREHGIDLRLVTVPAFFSKSSCVYNPIIYCFMNKQFRACIMETVCGRPMSDDSEMSSSAQRTEVSSVSSSQVGPS